MRINKHRTKRTEALVLPLHRSNDKTNSLILNFLIAGCTALEIQSSRTKVVIAPTKNSGDNSVCKTRAHCTHVENTQSDIAVSKAALQRDTA